MTWRGYSDYEATNWAGFLNLSYLITDKLNLTAGVRYSSEEKEVDYDLGYYPQPFMLLVLGLPAWQGTEDADWQTVTPRFLVDYKLTDDVLFFASAARGFRAGHIYPINKRFNEPMMFTWAS